MNGWRVLDGKIGFYFRRDIGCLTKFKTRGVEISSERAECKIGGGKSNKKETRLSVVRNKIKRRVSLMARATVSVVITEKESDILTKRFENNAHKTHKSTETIFRVAYFNAKNNKPFQTGMTIGTTLQHSRFSSTNIISHIAAEIKENIVLNIILNLPLNYQSW